MYESVTISLTGNIPNYILYELFSISKRSSGFGNSFVMFTNNSFPNINSTNNRLEIEVIPSES